MTQPTPVNFLRVMQLLAKGYFLLGELPEEAVKWNALRQGGMFLFVNNKDEYYFCREGFLRDKDPIEFDADNKPVDKGYFGQIDTMNFNFVIVHTEITKTCAYEKKILVLKHLAQSGHVSILGRTYFDIGNLKIINAKNVYAGEIYFFLTQILMINAKSGNFPILPEVVRTQLDKIFGAIVSDVFRLDITQEATDASFNELGPRILKRSQASSLSNPWLGERTLSAPPNPRYSGTTLSAPRFAIEASEEKPHEPLQSNPLMGFIKKRFEECTSKDLAKGVQLLSAALKKKPRSVLSMIFRHNPPVDCLLELARKVKQQAKKPLPCSVLDLKQLCEVYLPGIGNSVEEKPESLPVLDAATETLAKGFHPLPVVVARYPCSSLFFFTNSNLFKTNKWPAISNTAQTIKT